MCGIAGGFWGDASLDFRERFSKALDLMATRGPDDRGFEAYRSDEGLVALGHNRLSIIDLSSAGHQPMMSHDRRYSIVFNGEIYNYRELRKDLSSAGIKFVSDSDTEVLLSAWIHWGVDCLARLEGMFAFAVYDSKEECLTCVRDAFGIKPFFYSSDPGQFVFASEQPALIMLRGRKPQADWQRSYDYLVHGDYDSQEHTFIDGVKHLMPGHLLQINLKSSQVSQPQCWWHPVIQQSSELTFDQAAEAVREQFLHNIRLHLRSDVPLGAALSGGIDSSAVVCAMRYVEPDVPINTFSYIAQGTKLSEEKWVDQINDFVDAKAHKVIATGEDLARDLDKVIRIQGEPFGSTSIYAQYRVFQLAREHGVVVTLDGQGADELLAGYSGYPGQRLYSFIEERNYVAAYFFAKNWSDWPGRRYPQALKSLGSLLLPERLRRIRHKFINGPHRDWLKTDLLIEAGVKFSVRRVPLLKSSSGRRVMERLADALQVKGLPSLLRHGDRNSMQFSVESRVPFLTIPMSALLLSLPESYLISNSGETKSVFRAAMRGIVPDEILDRKDKIGFATPEKSWFVSMGPQVREWLQDSESIPFLNREALLTAFDAAMRGDSIFSWQTWRWVNYVRWHTLTVC